MTSETDFSVLAVVSESSEDHGEEIVLLCETLGWPVAEVVFLPITKRIDPATYMGQGTAEHVLERMEKLGCHGLVVDAPLSPSQTRNLEKIIKLPVHDRQGVILSIFENHARTKLAKLQVELAKLKYLQPRLTKIWQGLSRQRGARGGLGGRGLGETRLELDRRVVRERIATLKDKLKKAESVFQTQSSRRSHLPRVSLVGYTNAGKSTLMRRLTKSDVLVENKLFSTLDTTVKTLYPPTKPEILIGDTVGFIRDLPPDLVASFKSTLQEVLESDLILHVLDASHPRFQEHLKTTEKVLEDLDAKKIPRVFILNKKDRMPTNARKGYELQVKLFSRGAKIFWTSAMTGEGVSELAQYLRENFDAKIPEWFAQETGLEGEI